MPSSTTNFISPVRPTTCSALTDHIQALNTLHFKFKMKCTGCGRNNSHISKGNKNQMKQGTQKNLLFIKSTYNAVFLKHF